MRMTVANIADESFLRAQLQGDWNLADMMGIVGTLPDTARTYGKDRVLLNFRGLGGAVPDMDRRYFGQRAGELWTDLKVACVATATRINGIAERAATEAGVRVRVFSSEEDAIQWLLS